MSPTFRGILPFISLKSKNISKPRKQTSVKQGSKFASCSESVWPPLWSSGQSSWLQIRRPGFDSRHYQKKQWVWNGVHSASWVQLRTNNYKWISAIATQYFICILILHHHSTVPSHDLFRPTGPSSGEFTNAKILHTTRRLSYPTDLLF
jgi:hypothetical protein